MTRYKPYKEFINEAYKSYNDPAKLNGRVGNPQRLGQHLMNCLYAEHPRLYRVVTESPFRVDPFYNNKHIDAFKLYIEKYWERDN